MNPTPPLVLSTETDLNEYLRGRRSGRSKAFSIRPDRCRGFGLRLSLMPSWSNCVIRYRMIAAGSLSCSLVRFLTNLGKPQQPS